MYAKLTDGREIRIHFVHLRTSAGIPTVTLCNLYPAISKYAAPFAQAEAYCHPNDTYSKETGRKLALTRALEAAGLGKEDRRRVWLAYHGRRGGVLNRYAGKQEAILKDAAAILATAH